MAGMSRAVASLWALVIILFARVVTGVRGNWAGGMPSAARRVYFANHASHGDFILIWAVIPARYRIDTRPVAAADYWGASRLRRFLSERVLRAVLIDRKRTDPGASPVDQMAEALEASSLIMFPEGTRNTTDAALLPFKSGLFRLAKACPEAEIVPVWIANLNRVLPKGEFLPVPLLCTVTFGAPLRVMETEDSAAFLDRARSALLALAPRKDRP
jgi:1-acyl-sn-glycerol-3-phosphate acyltransferase